MPALLSTKYLHDPRNTIFSLTIDLKTLKALFSTGVEDATRGEYVEIDFNKLFNAK